MQSISMATTNVGLKAAVSIIIAHQMADAIIKASAINSSPATVRGLLSAAGFGMRTIDALIGSAQLIAATVDATAH